MTEQPLDSRAQIKHFVVNGVVFAAIGLVLLVPAFWHYTDPRGGHMHYINLHKNLNNAYAAFFGSSRVSGIDESYLTRENHKKFHKIIAGSGGPLYFGPWDKFILKKYYPRPEVMIFEISDYSLHYLFRTLDNDIKYFPVKAFMGELFDPQFPIDFKTMIKVRVNKSDLLRNVFEILIDLATKTQAQIKRLLLESAYAAESNVGMAEYNGFAPKSFTSVIAGTFPPPKVNKEHVIPFLEFVEYFSKESENGGIKVVFLNLPDPIAFYPPNPDTVRFLRNVAEKHHIPFLDYNSVDKRTEFNFDWRNFQDSLHINERGGSQFRKRLQRDLDAVLKGDRVAAQPDLEQINPLPDLRPLVRNVLSNALRASNESDSSTANQEYGQTATWEKVFGEGMHVYSEFHDYRKAREYFEMALEKTEKFDPDDPRRPVTLDYLANTYLLTEGRDGVARAEPILKELLRYLECRKSDPEDLMLADIVSDLAVIYERQGRFAEAEPLFKRALTIRRSIWNSHPDVVAVRNNLAMFYKKQGRETEAAMISMPWEETIKRCVPAGENNYLEYCQLAVEKAEEMGPHSPQMAISLKRLAETYDTQSKLADELSNRADKILSTVSQEVCDDQGMRAIEQGDYARAEFFLTEALKKIEELDPRNPRLTVILDTLVDLYQKQGEFTEAELLLKRELVTNESKYNPIKAFFFSDPELISSLNKLADNYYSQGKLTEAEPLLKRVLSLLQKKPFVSYLDSAATREKLARLYIQQGRDVEAAKYLPLETVSKNGEDLQEKGDYAKAVKYFEVAFKKMEELDPRDPRLAVILNTLADLYQKQDKFAEAELFLQRALSILRKKQGASHPDVLAMQEKLALFYVAQNRIVEASALFSSEEFSGMGTQAASKGDFDRAILFFKMALGKIKMMGSHDPRLFPALNNLAGLYQKKRQWNEAEELFKRILSLHENEHILDNAQLASTFNNLAGLYYVQSRFNEAEPLFKLALSMRTAELGASHPNVVAIQASLSALYIAQKRFPEAEGILKTSIAALKKSEGPVPLMITLLENYASLLQLTGHIDEAEEIIRQFKKLKNSSPTKRMGI